MKWRRCAHPSVLLTQPLATGAPPLCAMEPSNRQLGDVGTGWWPLTMTSKTCNSTLIGLFQWRHCECYGWQDSCWGLQWSQMPYHHIYTLLWQNLSAQLIDKLQIYPIICQVCFSFGWASGWLFVRTYPQRSSTPRYYPNSLVYLDIYTTFCFSTNRNGGDIKHF